MDKPTFFRFFGAAVFAVATLVLFLTTRDGITTNLGSVEKPASELQRDFSETLAEIDREVDTVLTRFRIERSWMRRRAIEIPSTGFARIERRVAIPQELVPVMLNHELNTMAHRYNGRAVASESVRDNTVTIHIELEGYIVQTIILKHSEDLRRPKQKEKPRRA